ncbi:related to monosaccharide transporter [Cephalotrichum gorgonifer]|uniref:Related to monosaccharide transporter n=1 Tax=Cephalotrichum gorgonifer TaxID=2041049 RepID=A0AAE8N5B3_9PEZI|nr:related to monosaccharide transporter [Cephalotrichum gorgonifer]
MEKSHEASEPQEAGPEWRTAEGVRDTSLRGNWRILLVTLYIGMSLFEYGFDKGVVAGFQAMPGFLQVFGYQTPDGSWEIESTPQQIITSFMTVGGIVGSLATGPIGAHLCRRYSLMIASVFIVASTVIMSETTSFGALYFARLLVGVANGVFINFATVFLGEIAPPHLRGLCFGIACFWITLGRVIGMVVNNATADIMSRKAYQIPLYICFVIPVFLILTLPFLPESPRWLIQHNRPEEALKSLRAYRKGTYDEVAIQQEFEEMKMVAEHEAAAGKDWRLMLEMFRGANLRRTIISIGVTSANAGVGTMFILSFGTYFLKIAKVSNPFMWTIVTNCFGLVGLILSWCAITRVGRRRLILASCIICAVAMLLVAVLYTVPGLSPSKAGTGLVVAVSLFLFGFNFGLESYAFLTSGEMPAQNLRAYTQGLSIAVSFVLAWVCTFTAPYFINPAELNWGPKYGWIWFGSSIITIAFVYFMLPDVNGRSLEEIDEMFRNKVSTRGFKTYVCVEVEQARSRGTMNALAHGEKTLDQEDIQDEGNAKNVS